MVRKTKNVAARVGNTADEPAVPQQRGQKRKAPLGALAVQFSREAGLVNQGVAIRDRIRSVERVFRVLFADPDFVRLLQAEGIDSAPEPLLARIEAESFRA